MAGLAQHQANADAASLGDQQLPRFDLELFIREAILGNGQVYDVADLKRKRGQPELCRDRHLLTGSEKSLLGDPLRPCAIRHHRQRQVHEVFDAVVFRVQEEAAADGWVISFNPIRAGIDEAADDPVEVVAARHLGRQRDAAAEIIKREGFDGRFIDADPQLPFPARIVERTIARLHHVGQRRANCRVCPDNAVDGVAVLSAAF